MASQVLRLGGEVDAADHPGGRQGRHLVVVDRQHTQVIVRASCEVVYQDLLTGWWYHPVQE